MGNGFGSFIFSAILILNINAHMSTTGDILCYRSVMSQYQNSENGIYWYSSKVADLKGEALCIFLVGVCLCVELPDFVI